MNQYGVVVTGIGMVTPLAIGREPTWEALLAGRSGIRRERDGRLLATVPGLDVPPETRLLSMAFLAAGEAIADSGVRDAVEPERIGCLVSVSKPYLVPGADRVTLNDLFMPSFTGQQLARVFGLQGPVRNISSACATGTNAALLASRWIEEGVCDAVLCGAVESSLHPLYRHGFDRMGVLAKGTVRPFDAFREGFAIGEGAGVLVIERKDLAVLRGARSYGGIAGGCMANDAAHPVAFGSAGATIAMAIKKTLAALPAGTVEYINAHGTATRLNDAIETRAIRSVFGAGANAIAVSSTKAATGHLLGASGAVELGFCLLALRDGMVPPTLNLENPDEECDLDYVPQTARQTAVNTALSLSFGFGGQIGVIAVTKQQL